MGGEDKEDKPVSAINPLRQPSIVEEEQQGGTLSHGPAQGEGASGCWVWDPVSVHKHRLRTRLQGSSYCYDEDSSLPHSRQCLVLEPVYFLQYICDMKSADPVVCCSC